MGRKTVILLALLLPNLLMATSVYLMNDSSYPLRAVIRANDGTYLGEMVLNPQTTSTWSDGGRPSAGLERYPSTRTPYMVTWYCMEGSIFSVFQSAPTGGTASALAGSGTKACKPKKKKQNSQETNPEGNLHEGIPGAGGPQVPSQP